MVNFVRIPWPPGPSWRQSVVLDSNIFRIVSNWNEVALFWSISLLTRDNEPIVEGIKITSGALLTSRIPDLRLPKGYFVVISSLPCGCVPGRNDMAVNADLIYVSVI